MSQTPGPTTPTPSEGDAAESLAPDEPAGAPAASSPPSSAAVLRARAALDAGEPWRARDALTDAVASHRDLEALVLLGEVQQRMGDLPAAGAAWFGTSAKGPEVDAAISAWRDRHGDDFGDMWRSLPASVRARPRVPKVEALRAKAKQADAARAAATAADPAVAEEVAEAASGGFDAAQFILWLLAAFFVVCAAVGLVQILRWVVPGS